MPSKVKQNDAYIAKVSVKPDKLNSSRKHTLGYSFEVPHAELFEPGGGLGWVGGGEQYYL